MATGSGIIRKVSGKVGDLVYVVRGGQQIIRGVPTSIKNPRTEAQMEQRMKWPNILAVYRTLSPYLKDCFENKPAGQTDYNRFMGINLNAGPVYLEKDKVRLGAAIVAPYVISQGSLPAIQVSGATPATDIALGALEIGDDTTVGELAQAVVQNPSSASCRRRTARTGTPTSPSRPHASTSTRPTPPSCATWPRPRASAPSAGRWERTRHWRGQAWPGCTAGR